MVVPLYKRRRSRISQDREKVNIDLKQIKNAPFEKAHFQVKYTCNKETEATKKRERKSMSIVTIKKSIAKYLEKHGAELICSLAMLGGSTDSFQTYLENYLCVRKQA